MNQDIQITGLPRCGSAFLATLLNLTPRCIGFHDVISTDVHWLDTLERARDEYDFVADCGTYQFLPKATIPGATKVFIRRPSSESREEAQKRFGYPIDPGSYRLLETLAEEWIAEERPLVVNYATLWNVRSLEEIWNHCFAGEVRFPEQKAALLLHNNIQRHDPEKAFAMDSLSSRVRDLF